jgi:hypothetical protein
MPAPKTETRGESKYDDEEFEPLDDTTTVPAPQGAFRPSENGQVSEQQEEDDSTAPHKIVRQETGRRKGPAAVKAEDEGFMAWRHYHTLYPVCNKLLAKK